MLITPSLLEAYNGINQDVMDENTTELINIYIGMAQQIINDYVGFDVEDIISEKSTFSTSEVALFKNIELRIATLIQQESGGNLGVSNSAEMGASRSFLNIVDYTPYLKPLSAFRKNTDL